jgi:hypothetical protein
MIDSSLFLLIMILTLVKLRAPFLEKKKKGQRYLDCTNLY